jgi:hypothetical protein
MSSADRSKDLGGLSVILVRDHFQLPPVNDVPLHVYPRKEGKKFDEFEAGHLLYRKFNQAVVLTIQQRQVGEDPGSRRFRKLLGRLRVGGSTQIDWSFLMTRSLPALLDEEQETFQNAIRLYSMNAPSVAHNMEMLKNMNIPVAALQAKHNTEHARTATTDQAGGLHADICLAIGCRVMLLANLNTAHDLVNGDLGNVV